VVCTAHEVTAAGDRAKETPPDAMLLVCHAAGADDQAPAAVQDLRSAGFEGLIVVLGARPDTSHVVDVLDSGADDYVRYPYDPAEVVARLRALATRASGLMWLDPLGSIVLDRWRRVVRCAGGQVSLTTREAALLVCLARNTGRVVPREEIVARVWGAERDSNSMRNLVEVYISYVRRKLGHLNSTVRLRAVRGVGYQLAGSASDLRRCVPERGERANGKRTSTPDCLPPAIKPEHHLHALG
jgi:DNA-binding response OmpR family regulator